MTIQSAAPVERSDFLQAIDWQRPWMQSLREVGEPLCAPGTDWRAAINSIARACGAATESGRAIEFVAQSELPAHASYEAFIHATGKVPTRDNLHDFFNALIWLRYPRIKARLNALQAADIASAQSPAEVLSLAAPAQRSRLRDALTLFDENAVIVVTSDPSICALLRSHAWSELFEARRAMLGISYDVFSFGHALIEKLVAPYKAITAHARMLLVEPVFFTQSAIKKNQVIDCLIAQQLNHHLRPAVFSPLPVLGLPGWWCNQDAAFYADVQVFRPPRSIAHSLNSQITKT